MYELEMTMTLAPFCMTAGYYPVPLGASAPSKPLIPFAPTPPIAYADALPVAVLGQSPTIEQIYAVEDALLALRTRVGLKHEDHFAPGVYVRALRIPAGVALTGREHITEHLSILAEGTIDVWTEGGMQTISAPAVLRSKPGAKRVGMALTQCTWITIHENPDNELDSSKIIDAITRTDRVINGEVLQ